MSNLPTRYADIPSERVEQQGGESRPFSPDDIDPVNVADIDGLIRSCVQSIEGQRKNSRIRFLDAHLVRIDDGVKQLCDATLL